MKKIMLSAAALLIGTIAFAQVSGAPTADQSLVPQNSADAEANAGLSIQNGNDNKVRVRQAGELNTSYTEQDNGTLGSGGNLARVRQTGAVNGNVGDSGEDNAAEVRQSGTANQSTTRQEGDRNNAYTAQGQNDDGASTGNKARIQQGIANQAEDNFAAIEQDGDNNQANTLQTTDNSDAWTRQIGNDNKSMITQNAAPEDSDGHLANNYQEGNGNENAIMQSGAGARNTATSEQVGDNNKAKQTQTTDALEGGVGNTAMNFQGFTGATNADISMSNAIFVDINSNVDDVFGGSDITGSGTNQSFGGIVFQNQGGNDNEAAAFQYGSASDGSNYIKQTQASGTGNDAFAIQNRYDGPGGGDNEGEQFQAGDNNLLGLSQIGTGHKSLQTQEGDDNKALSAQQGTDNLLNIHQRGNDNWATSAQRGDANAALIVQRDGQSFIAQQNLDGLGGGGNQIDALQLGPDGDFGTDGIDCGFNEQMDPTMDYTIDPFDLGDVCPGC